MRNSRIKDMGRNNEEGCIHTEINNVLFTNRHKKRALQRTDTCNSVITIQIRDSMLRSYGFPTNAYVSNGIRSSFVLEKRTNKNKSASRSNGLLNDLELM